MATATGDSTLEIPAAGLPGDSGRSLRIPAPIIIEDGASSSPRSPFSTSPETSLPLPNPDFVFPERQASTSAPSSFSRASGRRTKSAFEPADRLPEILRQVNDRSPAGSPALPDFSFNPGASLGSGPSSRQPRSPARSPALPDFSFNPGASLDTDSTLLSPSYGPPSPRMPPGRHGHRRGTSEFVGGKIKAGESITVMSTSPTKPESGFASPLLKPTEQPPRRRGHQHRRSAAISQHDLTMILKPNVNQSHGNSAPTSPAILKPTTPPPSESQLELGTSEDKQDIVPRPEAAKVDEPIVEPKIEPQVAEPGSTTPPKSATRARVGFSDTLEFIPRPLSLVSTDTTSTMTTVRAGGHSASNSISSVISLGGAIVNDREHANYPRPTTPAAKSGSRPSTAGAVLENIPSLALPQAENMSPRRRNSIPLLIGLVQEDSVEPSQSTPTKTPKRWSFFGLDPFTGSHIPSKGRPHSPSSPELTDEQPGDIEPGQPKMDDAEEASANTKKSSSKKKKQKKVRSWGTSILTRKGKSRAVKTIAGRRRSLTPPPRGAMFDDDVEDEEPELSRLTPFAPMTVESFSTSTQLPRRPRSSEEETSYQMIDLDAALGPFNTPSYNPEWEAAQRTGAAPRRPLHSAAGMRGFSGPGMHYHRRAESAPALPPFEGRFGMNRFGSSSTMADVFEEDEEDSAVISDASSSNKSITVSSEHHTTADDSSASENDSADTPTQERDLGIVMPSDTSSIRSSVKRQGSSSSLDLPPVGSKMRSEIAGGSLHEYVIVEEETENNQKPASDTSSVAPSPRRILAGRDPTPVDVNTITLPPPSLLSASPYSMNHSSSFPSPRSPMSDAHRISTAPSSIADENSFHSLLMGEPGPEIIRISVDVPSLTSSNSTMTRDSTFLPPVRPRGKPFHDQRPASFTSTAFGRRRSSLASLSRLISSAHGERSKLSEEVAIEDEPEKKQKVSKSKRISRMMQFWKSKQPAES